MKSEASERFLLQSPADLMQTGCVSPLSTNGNAVILMTKSIRESDALCMLHEQQQQRLLDSPNGLSADFPGDPDSIQY
jgi:hypothetical protein